MERGGAAAGSVGGLGGGGGLQRWAFALPGGKPSVCRMCVGPHGILGAVQGDSFSLLCDPLHFFLSLALTLREPSVVLYGTRADCLNGLAFWGHEWLRLVRIEAFHKVSLFAQFIESGLHRIQLTFQPSLPA